MKKLSIYLLGLVFVLGTAGMASADPFTSLVNFGGTGSITINDTPNTIDPGDSGYIYAFSYSHTVNFDPAAAEITDATLTLRHKGNAGYDLGHGLILDWGEVWFLWNDTANLIGNLANSQGIFSGFWVEQDFVLPGSLFAGVSGSSWTIGFKLDENTWGEGETLQVDWSKLQGNYNPVPEPVSMLLFGVGLIGIGGYVRRRFK